MTIYLDVWFLLNFLVDDLLLLATARMAGEWLRRGRFALAACFGAFYASCCFLPGLNFLSAPRWVCLAALGMLWIAYGFSRRFLRLSALFFCAAFALGGGLLAVSGFSGAAGGSGALPQLAMVLGSAAAGYAAVCLLFGRLARHGGDRGDLFSGEVCFREKRVPLTILRDSGNTLTEPFSGRPVLVAEGERLQLLFPPGTAPGAAELRTPAKALERLHSEGFAGRLSLLPYQAVGTESGLMLALRTDSVRVGKQSYPGMLVALAPNPLSDGGGYQALVNL